MFFCSLVQPNLMLITLSLWRMHVFHGRNIQVFFFFFLQLLILQNTYKIPLFQALKLPSLATRRLEIASGILVPAARKTNPMMTSGTPIVKPINDTCKNKRDYIFIKTSNNVFIKVHFYKTKSRSKKYC